MLVGRTLSASDAAENHEDPQTVAVNLDGEKAVNNMTFRI